MESTIRQISNSAFAIIGPEGATNFTIIKGSDGSAALIDADIRRIDEVEEALQLTGCGRVGYLIDTTSISTTPRPISTSRRSMFPSSPAPVVCKRCGATA